MRGRSRSPPASRRTASGARVSRSATYGLVASSRASRSAVPPATGGPTPPSSRSRRRYQGVRPSASRHPPVRQQAGVRIGGVGERFEHGRQQHPLHRRRPADAAGQRLQMPERRRGIGEAERLQPGRSRCARTAAPPPPDSARARGCESSPAGSRATAVSSGR